MDKLRSILRDIALVTYSVAGVILCLVLWKASKTLDGANVALATVNRPKSGTLSMLDDTILQGRLTIDAMNKVLIHEQSQLGTLDTDIASLSEHANATLTALTGTATTASTSLQALSDGLTPVLKHVDAATVDSDAAIKGLFPVESDTDRLVRDFDAQVTSPAVGQALKGVADTSTQFAIISEQGAYIAKDLHKEADALTAKKPWYEKLGAYTTTGVNILCLATHSCPF